METIKLGNTEFEGKNNVYVLRGDGEVTLVDTGVSTPSTRESLRDSLAGSNLSIEDVDNVVLTHWHADHSGLAGEIQRASGAAVFVHERDAPLVRDPAEAVASLERMQRRTFAEWGMPDDELDAFFAFLDGGESIRGEPAEVTTVRDGDRIEVSGHQLEVVHAPGHTDGSVCYAMDGGTEAFVGDVVLPVYTPNVGGADLRVERPLEKYVDTLERIAEREFRRVYPGHRGVVEAPGERIRTILNHHRERTENVVEVLREHGPADPWTVSDHLFGDLEGIHIMHGPGEAFAHLDHLARHGVVTETPEGYVLSPESGDDVGALF